MTRKQHLPRVRYLAGKYAHDLQALAGTQHMRARILRLPEGAFSLALAMDPTPKAIYLATILRWLEASAIRFEDARDTRDILARFHADKHRLAIWQRDIGLYVSPGDIAALLDPREEIVVRDVPEEIMEGCRIEARGETWILLKLLNTEAAMWWGDSTQWCTRHRDTARHYLSNMPIYVLATPEAKYQVSPDQFMDVYDRPVTDAPDLPTEALEATLNVIRDRPSADVTFFPDDIGSVLQGMLDTRAGKVGNPFNKLSRNDIGSGWFPGWSTRDRTLRVVDDFPGNNNGWRPRKADGRNTVTVVRNGVMTPLPREALEDGRQSAHRNWKREDVDVLLAFLRSEASRVPQTEGMHMFPPGHGMGMIAQAFLAGARRGCLVRSGGDRFAMWTVGLDDPEGSHSKPGVALIDLDGIEYRKLHQVTSAEKLAGMPDRIRAAIRRFVGSSPAWPTLVLALGADSASGGSFEEWKTGDGISLILEHILMTEDRSALEVENVVRELIDWHKAESMLRLLGSLRSLHVRSSWQLRTNPCRDKPTAEDLLRCKDIFGAGFLLAALPDEECTDELVDALLEAGRGEVVNVLPARMITEERLRHSGGTMASICPILHDRIVSQDAYQAVLSTQAWIPTLEALENWMERRLKAGNPEQMGLC